MVSLDDHGRVKLDISRALDFLGPDDKARIARALSQAAEAQAVANEAKRELLRTLETILPQGETIMGDNWSAASKPVLFEGVGMCFYETGAFRPPRAGDFYLSGNPVQAWRAPNDLGTSYRVVRPTHYAMQRTVWEKGDRVQYDANGRPLRLMPRGG